VRAADSIQGSAGSTGCGGRITRSIRLILPLPPSVNHLYRHGGAGSRKLTDRAIAWYAAARAEILAQQAARGRATLGAGPYAVRIRLPLRDRADIDNRVKAVLDVLHQSGLTPDDAYCHLLSIGRSCHAPSDHVVVHVRSLPCANMEAQQKPPDDAVPSRRSRLRVDHIAVISGRRRRQLRMTSIP